MVGRIKNNESLKSRNNKYEDKKKREKKRKNKN
jgi:hypothetical protein